MARGKKSFFDRLTGSVSIDDYDNEYSEKEENPSEGNNDKQQWIEEDDTEGQLTVDVYQKPDEIIIKAIVAGVKPDDLEVTITRDMVILRGRREELKEVEEDNYFYKELYWGSFSRTILLPQEIDVEEAQANEKHGLITIRLPKIDKERQTKLKVKSG